MDENLIIPALDTPVPPTSDTPPTDKPTLKNRVPCNWALVPAESNLVRGYNGISGETFIGSIAEFNDALKGL